MNPDHIEAQQERIQTRIEMIRTESRVLSFKIERMEQQRHELQEEKRKLKELLNHSQREQALKSLQESADEQFLTPKNK
jgi:phage terminase small subunit